MVRRALRRSSAGETGDRRNDSQGSESVCDTVTSDIVRGFVEAQSNLANNANENQEIISLLQKVASQLENLQGNQSNQQLPQSGNQPPKQQGQKEQEKDASAQSSGSAYSEPQKENKQSSAQNKVTQQLQSLFSQVLLNNNSQDSQKTDSSSSETEQSSASQGQNNKQSAMAVQTASQVLAQAQYELANELEASLEKLKQVISESEKIANQISNLLGESSNKKS